MALHPDHELYINWTIKAVAETEEGGYIFRVHHIRGPGKATVVYIPPRHSFDAYWTCETCNKTWTTGRDLENFCAHIRRAFYYHRDMLKRGEELKSKLKPKHEPEVIINPNAKRSIKLEE